MLKPGKGRYACKHTGCPRKVFEFYIEITSEIFDPENQFGYFRKAGT